MLNFIFKVRMLKGEKVLIILGGKVKKIRKNLGLTQKELSQGICTQVTISKIENYNNVPSMRILSELCKRLSISIHDICKTEAGSNNAYEVFKKVDELCRQFEHQKAFRLLTSKLKQKDLSQNDLKQYYYYKGMTLLSGFNNLKDALFNFNLVLLTNRSDTHSMLDILATNAIGITYFAGSEKQKGKEYLDRSIDYLNQIPYVTSDNYIKVPYIYYNSAKIYSQLEDYSTAIQLCTQGILFLKEREITYLLDALLYEQGYNLYQNKQKKEAEKYYLMASGVSFFKGNKILLEVIKKDCINFKLRSSELLQEVKL